MKSKIIHGLIPLLLLSMIGGNLQADEAKVIWTKSPKVTLWDVLNDPTEAEILAVNGDGTQNYMYFFYPAGSNLAIFFGDVKHSGLVRCNVDSPDDCYYLYKR